MSVRFLEAGIASGFGAVDAAVDARAGTTNWGSGAFNQRWSLILELAGLASGLWGQRVGMGAEVREPLALASLALLGRRATRYAMAAGGVGNLVKPATWAAMGGGDGDSSFVAVGDGFDSSSSIIPLSAGGLVGRPSRVGGGYPVYPPTQEAPGIAG